MQTAIALGLLGFFVETFEKLITGTGMISRPIVTGFLTGILMGDIQTGLLIGATMELIFLGTFSIGATQPPEMISGTILATAFAISTGQGMEAAITLGVPIAAFVLVIKNFVLVFGYPVVMAISDKYAEAGDIDGVGRTHFISGFFTRALPIGLTIGIAYYVGSSVVGNVLAAIPDYVKSGLQVATGLMPALGFALLARMILNKKVAVFYFLGFVLVAYFKLPFLGVAILGVITAVILLTNDNSQRPATETNTDDDF